MPTPSPNFFHVRGLSAPLLVVVHRRRVVVTSENAWTTDASAAGIMRTGASSASRPRARSAGRTRLPTSSGSGRRRLAALAEARAPSFLDERLRLFGLCIGLVPPALRPRRSPRPPSRVELAEQPDAR
jgi:hypothetical protein